MTQDEIIEMARQAGFDISKPNRIIVRHSNGSWISIKFELEAFAKLVAAKERENIKHSLVASSVSVQSRVYVGEEVISNLRMTHEEIQARGEA